MTFQLIFSPSRLDTYNIYLVNFSLSSSEMNANNLAQLHKYVPPKWASSLKNIPKHSLKVNNMNADQIVQSKYESVFVYQ